MDEVTAGISSKMTKKSFVRSPSAGCTRTITWAGSALSRDIQPTQLGDTQFSAALFGPALLFPFGGPIFVR